MIIKREPAMLFETEKFLILVNDWNYVEDVMLIEMKRLTSSPPHLLISSSPHLLNT
jgi:hypothetical protein